MIPVKAVYRFAVDFITEKYIEYDKKLDVENTEDGLRVNCVYR